MAPQAAHVYVEYYGQKEILLRAYKSRHSRCSGALSPLEDLTTDC